MGYEKAEETPEAKVEAPKRPAYGSFEVVPAENFGVEDVPMEEPVEKKEKKDKKKKEKKVDDKPYYKVEEPVIEAEPVVEIAQEEPEETNEETV